jgi:hypothetical protein
VPAPCCPGVAHSRSSLPTWSGWSFPHSREGPWTRWAFLSYAVCGSSPILASLPVSPASAQVRPLIGACRSHQLLRTKSAALFRSALSFHSGPILASACDYRHLLSTWEPSTLSLVCPGLETLGASPLIRSPVAQPAGMSPTCSKAGQLGRGPETAVEKESSLARPRWTALSSSSSTSTSHLASSANTPGAPPPLSV